MFMGDALTLCVRAAGDVIGGVADDEEDEDEEDEELDVDDLNPIPPLF